ncbi:alpha/beta hydrolase [Amphritea sp. 1_MG-2023]|uniref:alpha/beta hydrolase n=1 Tax=Amphritea sp. 1_MG-2023 TaxID=3062670 RepID=UPI0026E14F6B|nr:alpha/beta hydrolase [Amphritea sp. 1_MG-2023]MDO6563017.1 alpha/beta hydrolase [Amphritea sp. 1_MG-2023]
MRMLDAKCLRNSLPVFNQAAGISSCELLTEYLNCYQLNSIIHAGHRLSASQQVVQGCALFVQHYSCRDTSRGTAVVVHGYFDHSGLYRHLISYLLEIGWNVLIFDLPGHGLSQGPPLAIESFTTYAEKLTALLNSRKEHLTGPWVLIGQSTGAAILMEQQLKFGFYDWPIKQQVFLAPLVRPCGWQEIASQYRWLRFLRRSVPRRYSLSSGDQAFLDFVRYEDPLQHRRIPVRWIGAMLRWIDEVEQSASLTTQPLCIQGVEDTTVEWRHNLGVIGRLYPGLEIKLLQHARHHLVNESTALRLQVFKLIEQSLNVAGNEATLS